MSGNLLPARLSAEVVTKPLRRGFSTVEPPSCALQLACLAFVAAAPPRGHGQKGSVPLPVVGFPAPLLSQHCLEGGLSPAQRGLALGAPTRSGTPEPLEPWGGGTGALRWPWVLRGHCGGPGSLPSSGGLCLRHLFMLCCCRPFGLTSSSISWMKKAPTW